MTVVMEDAPPVADDGGGANAPMAAPPPRPWLTSVTVAVGLAGAALRVHEFAVRRSLWFDEAAVSLNVVQRSVGGLFHPLADNQGAPIGYLLLTKLCVWLLGANEYSLRLPALLGGLAALPLTYLVARRVLGPRAAVVALALVAFGGRLVYFSAEAKQYSVDVAVAALVLLLVLRARDRAWDRRSVTILAVAGAVAVWVSHPAIFVLAGAGVVGLVETLRRRDWAPAGRLTGAGAVWLASFGAEYVVSLSKLDSNHSLVAYWSADFMPLPPRSVGDLKFFYHALTGLLQQLAGVRLDAALLVAVLAGLVVLARRHPAVLTLAVAPAVLALGASGLKAYPFGDRAVLFLAPVLAVVAAASVGLVADGPGRARGALAAVAAVVLVTIPLVAATRDQATVQREELRQVLASVRTDVRPGDTVFVYQGAVPAFRFYTRTDPLGGVRVVQEQQTCDTAVLERDVSGLPAGGRVWAVYSHFRRSGTIDQRAYQTDVLAGQRPLLADVEHYGAVAYLFGSVEPGRQSAPAIPAPPALPAAEC